LLENEIYYFGSNSYYESGNGDNKRLTSIIKLNNFQNVKKIECSKGLNLFLTGFLFLIFKIKKFKNLKKKECGKIYSIGNNGYGCIGDGTTIDCKTIKQIQFFKNIFIIDICCGNLHCLAISNKNVVYSWGNNNLGQLGNGNNNNQLTPIKIFTFKKK
jgi:alpha-tubulin suppressor-like RCC1 family protein